jgi:hypothetical protein
MIDLAETRYQCLPPVFIPPYMDSLSNPGSRTFVDLVREREVSPSGRDTTGAYLVS